MSTSIVLNKKESLIAHYFPNERMPEGYCINFSGTLIDVSYYNFKGTLEEWCKLCWSIENWFYRSRFIFKHGCIPNY